MKMLFIASDASGIAESGHSNDDPGNLYLRQLLFLLNWLHSQEGCFFPIWAPRKHHIYLLLTLSPVEWEPLRYGMDYVSPKFIGQSPNP